jgi:hypothetical protein
MIGVTSNLPAPPPPETAKRMAGWVRSRVLGASDGFRGRVSRPASAGFGA